MSPQHHLRVGLCSSVVLAACASGPVIDDTCPEPRPVATGVGIDWAEPPVPTPRVVRDDEHHMWIALEVPLPRERDPGMTEELFENYDPDVPGFAERRVAFLVDLPAPAYVYLIRERDAEGPKLVWPEHEPRMIEGQVRFPGEGWFELESEPGHSLFAFVVIRDGEPNELERALGFVTRNGRQYTPVGERVAGEGSYAGTLAHDGDAMRVDVWAEDETVIRLDIDNREGLRRRNGAQSERR